MKGHSAALDERPRRRPVPAAACSGPGPWETLAISDREFQEIRAWIHQVAGINLSNQKKPLVVGRLAARLRHYQLNTYGEYFQLLQSGLHASEVQIAIDLLTTNETHFFREPKHFDFLRDKLASGHSPRRQMA